MKYYAVKNGIKPGIYTDWGTAKCNVIGYKNAVYKSFKTHEDALLYINDINIKNDKNDKNDIKNDKNDKNDIKNDKNDIKNDKNDIKNDKNDKNNKNDYKNINILAYTDGSCKNKIGGFGLVLILNPNLKPVILEDSGPISYPCTNIIAEIYAINKVLTHLLPYSHDSIMIRTDSQYSIDCFTIYIKNWLKNGFMTVDKKPVKNQKLIMDTYHLLIQFKNLEFEHVYSHEGEYYNEMVDKLAKQYTI